MDTPTYYAIGPLHSASPVQPTGFSHQQVHHFRLAPLSREIQGCFAWEPQLTFELALSSIIMHNITSIDRHTGCRIWQVVIKTCGNLCFILHIGSRGCQRHGWTLNPNVLTCFKQEVCYVDRDRDPPQNHGSWISRELWRRGPEMRNPGKSHADWSWKLKESENSNFHSSKHATLNCGYYCDCRWKTVFKTVVTSAEAPGHCRSWRPPRPSPPAAAWRSPRGRGMLQNAAGWNLSTAGVGGTTRGGSQLWAPGPWLLRTSTAAPFARRKATTAGWSFHAARCSAATRSVPTNSKSRSRQRRSRRRWPRTAARSPWLAAQTMFRSRRGAKCSRNEVPQFPNLYVLSSLSPSLLLMEIIWNYIE